jgi:DNA-binding NarL/FixJ family response regulator
MDEITFWHIKSVSEVLYTADDGWEPFAAVANKKGEVKIYLKRQWRLPRPSGDAHPTEAPAKTKEDDLLKDLTPRELQVLKLVAEGKDNKEIAAVLGNSRRTVEIHRANITRKLGLSGGRNRLAEYVLRHHIFDPKKDTAPAHQETEEGVTKA